MSSTWTACGAGWRGWALALTGRILTPGGMTGDRTAQYPCRNMAPVASSLHCSWCWFLPSSLSMEAIGRTSQALGAGSGFLPCNGVGALAHKAGFAHKAGVAQLQCPACGHSQCNMKCWSNSSLHLQQALSCVAWHHLPAPVAATHRAAKDQPDIVQTCQTPCAMMLPRDSIPTANVQASIDPLG